RHGIVGNQGDTDGSLQQEENRFFQIGIRVCMGRIRAGKTSGIPPEIANTLPAKLCHGLDQMTAGRVILP
ncbi:MAG TPA: hypothetical protein VGC99_17695, partial [Candidatus Tectomicrobia bacterium]